MSRVKEELHRLVEALPEDEVSTFKRLLELTLAGLETQLQEKRGKAFYIEGPAGKYGEMEFINHLIVLDGVAGEGYISWYDENLEKFGETDFSRTQLPSVWPIFDALAARCNRSEEPFMGNEYDSLAKLKKHVGLEHVGLGEARLQNIPKTLSSVLKVAKLMWAGNTYPDAVRIVARERKVWRTTINNQCTRAIGLKANQFKELVRDERSLVQHLVGRFPDWRGVIKQEIPGSAGK